MLLVKMTIFGAITFLVTGPAENFIIRDPNCLYHGNFSIIERSKYLNVPPKKTLFVENHRDCAINCITTNSCSSFNYNEGLLKCELLFEYTGTKLDNGNWAFYTTDHSDPRNRGEKCRKLKPCPVESMCVDSCEENGYSCLPYYKEIAQGKSVSAINYYSANRKPEKAVDGLPYSDPAIAYSCYVSQNTLNPWFLLDLGAVYQMEIIRIVNEDHCPTCASRLFHMYITIGLTDTDPINNPVCVEDANQANIEKVDYTCDRSIMNGRYVFVHLKRKTLMAICEIQVYILA